MIKAKIEIRIASGSTSTVDENLLEKMGLEVTENTDGSGVQGTIYIKPSTVEAFITFFDEENNPLIDVITSNGQYTVVYDQEVFDKLKEAVG